MNKKEGYIIILLFIFTSILLFTHPIYTGMTTLCSTHTDIDTCMGDYDCIWEPDSEDVPEIGTCEDFPDTGNITDELTDFTPTLQEKIANLQTLQENPDKLEILAALNIDIITTISALNDYDLQVQDTQADTTLTEEEKQPIILNLEMQVDDLLINTPKTLTIINKITNFPSPPVSDITQEMLPVKLDPEEVLYIQEQLSAKTDFIAFEALTFSGEEISATYIKKTVNSPVSDGYLLEIIPATEQELLNFLGEYQVMTYNPLTISIPFSNSAALYSYIISGSISISQLQTAVIPYELEIEPTIQIICGDDICTQYLEDEITCPEDCARKVPWTIIIIIIIILIVGISLMALFKRKLSFLSSIKNIFKREKRLFRKESDKENLTNYIKRSLDENVPEEKIKAVLLAKGWKKEQIELILNEIRQPKEKYQESELTKEKPSEEEPEEDLEI